MVLPIPYVYKAKKLSVTFNYDLSWDDHVITICYKVKRLAEVTPNDTYCCPRDSYFHLLRLCILRIWLLYAEETYSGF
jgi:hypothetical protein